MSALALVIQPNPILQQVSRRLSKAELVQYVSLGQEMIDTMLNHNGVGLAAPQIGKNIQLFVINKDASLTDNHLVLCNPTITYASPKLSTLEEGCLSCPQLYRNVSRSEKVRVKAYYLDGTKVHFKAKGMFARVLQHEIDHLNGILIIDK